MLKIIKSMYAKKQVGWVRNNDLTYKLLTIGFKKLAIDKFVFFRGRAIFTCYVDDAIFPVPERNKSIKRSRTFRNMD